MHGWAALILSFVFEIIIFFLMIKYRNGFLKVLITVAFLLGVAIILGLALMLVSPSNAG
jgi:hypothetical protein